MSTNLRQSKRKRQGKPKSIQVLPTAKRQHLSSFEEDGKYIGDNKRCDIRNLPRWNRLWTKEELSYVIPANHKDKFYYGSHFLWDDRSIKKCKNCSSYTRNQFYMVLKDNDSKTAYPNTYYHNHYGSFSFIYISTRPSEIVHTYCEKCEDAIMFTIRAWDEEEIRYNTSGTNMFNTINSREKVHKQQKKLIRYILRNGYAEMIWKSLTPFMQKNLFNIYCCYTPKFMSSQTQRIITVDYDINSLFTQCVIFTVSETIPVAVPNMSNQHEHREEKEQKETFIQRQKRLQVRITSVKHRQQKAKNSLVSIQKQPMFRHEELGFLPLQHFQEELTSSLDTFL